MVKNLSTMQETQVQSLDGKSPWRREFSSILACIIPWTVETGCSCKESYIAVRLTHTHTHTHTLARLIKENKGEESNQ